MTNESLSSFQMLKAYYTRLFEALPGNHVLVQNDTPRFTVIAATPEYLAETGHTEKTFIGKGFFEAFPASVDPNDTGQQDVFQSYQHVLLHKQSHFLPAQRYDLQNEDGSFAETYWKASNKPVFGPDGEVAYIIHTAEDITDEIAAKDLMKQMKGMEQAHALFLQAPVAINILKGPDLIIELANAPCLEMWGKGTEIIGQSLLEVLPELQGLGFREILQQVRETGKSHQAYEQQAFGVKNNSLQGGYFNWVLQPYYEKNQKEATGVITFATEVTEKVLTQRQMEESNREFQVVTDFMPQMIWLTRPDGYHYYYNKQWYDFTGLTYGETEGEGWNNVFHPEDRERAWSVWRQSLETGEPYEIEYRCKRFDGTYRWFLGRALPLRDESGAILKWFGTCTDIDDQKQVAEIMEHKVEERTRELLLLNERLLQFTYAASHDLQEPLRKITFFLQRLLSNIKQSLNEENKRIAERIEHTIGRMRGLIDDLLDYSNTTLGITSSKEVDLTDVVKEVLEDMEVTIAEHGAKIDFGQLPVVKGDQMQLRQLFQNLVSNALKYQKKEETPHVQIRATLVKGSETEVKIPQERKEVMFYNIQLKDNGIGFHPDDAGRIFNPFQRLHGKTEYPGTGVGLAIVQKVIDNHHGYVWAEGQPGKGATFHLLLPAE